MCLCVPVAFCISGVVMILQYPFQKIGSVYKKCFPEKNNYTFFSVNNSEKKTIVVYTKHKNMIFSSIMEMWNLKFLNDDHRIT